MYMSVCGLRVMFLHRSSVLFAKSAEITAEAQDYLCNLTFKLVCSMHDAVLHSFCMLNRLHDIIILPTFDTLIRRSGHYNA